jgi:hypothetical protein
MDMSHDHTDFGAQIPFFGSKFSPLTPKSIFFLTPCKIPDRWICLTTILSLGPKFRLWALMAHFCLLIPKSIFFLYPCKIPDRWMYHTTILILGPKFRFWALGGLFLNFLTPTSVYFLHLYKISDRLMGHKHKTFFYF